MKVPVFIFFLLWATSVFAQLDSGGTFIHSHNDYAQRKPLLGALNARAKSIEIDVFLKDDDIMVAHSVSEIKKENTLEKMYILPLQNYLLQNPNVHDFHFMIDIKSEAVSTLKSIETILKKYPNIFNKNGVQLIISGNRPKAKTYPDYASFIWFDGREPADANKQGGERIAMISQNLSKFTRWRNEDKILPEQKSELISFINQCHKLNTPVRFWNTGDSKEMYRFLYKIGVDYINTDKPKELQKYLSKIDDSKSGT